MLDEVKGYLRIDGSEDDTFLTSLINAAESYIKKATGYQVNESDDLHKLAICMLVTNWYENREPIGKADKLAFSLQSILSQITYCRPGVPTSLRASVVNNFIDLYWDANTEDDLAGYKIYKDGTEIGTSVTNSYQVAYAVGAYRVSAYDKEGNESKLSEGVFL